MAYEEDGVRVNWTKIQTPGVLRWYWCSWLNKVLPSQTGQEDDSSSACSEAVIFQVSTTHKHKIKMLLIEFKTFKMREELSGSSRIQCSLQSLHADPDQISWWAKGHQNKGIFRYLFPNYEDSLISKIIYISIVTYVGVKCQQKKPQSEKKDCYKQM